MHQDSTPNITWEYIAGYFDGEGSVGVYTKNRRAVVIFTNSHRESLERIQQFIDAGKMIRRKGTNKPVYNLRIDRVAELQRILPELIQRCVIKRGQLESVLEAYGPHRIVELHESGMSITSIASMTDVTSGAVRKFLISRGIEPRGRNEAMALAYREGRWREGRTPVARAGIEEIRRLYWDEQLTIYEIADQLSVTHRSVAQYMSRYKIPTRTVKEAAILSATKGRRGYSKP